MSLKSQIAGLFYSLLIIGVTATQSYSSLNGVPVDESNYQNVVALSECNEIICSGTLVSKNIIYTAGHCILDERSIRLLHGKFARLLGNLGDEFIQHRNEFAFYIRSLSTLEEKRSELNRYLEAIISTKIEMLRIYLGTGVPGGKVEGEDIIEKIILSEEWIDVLRYTLFKSFDVLTEDEIKTPEEEFHFVAKSADFAEIHLKKDIDIEYDAIVRPFTRSEYANYHFTGGEIIRLVGFGYTKTFEESAGGNEYESAFGFKSRLDVSFNGFLSAGENEFIIVGSGHKSAAESDSGGPAFIQLYDGSWRYIGVIIATAPFPGEEFLFSIGKNSVKGTSLIFVKTLP